MQSCFADQTHAGRRVSAPWSPKAHPATTLFWEHPPWWFCTACRGGGCRALGIRCSSHRPCRVDCVIKFTYSGVVEESRPPERQGGRSGIRKGYRRQRTGVSTGTGRAASRTKLVPDGGSSAPWSPKAHPATTLLWQPPPWWFCAACRGGCRAPLTRSYNLRIGCSS